MSISVTGVDGTDLLSELASSFWPSPADTRTSLVVCRDQWLPRHYTPTLPVWGPVRGVMGCLRQQIYLSKSGSAAVTPAQTATEILLPYGRGVTYWISPLPNHPIPQSAQYFARKGWGVRTKLVIGQNTLSDVECGPDWNKLFLLLLSSWESAVECSPVCVV